MNTLFRNGMMQLFIVAIIVFQTSTMFGQDSNISIIVPRDPEIKTGVLPNGMTYYIRHNEEPKDRASFYMIQNVGALLENDDQNGLAHFLEHMAFNGTKHYPGKGVIEGLEEFGVKFGQNINAYTAFSETVYNMSDVPTSNPEAMDMCLMVLNDWSNYLLLQEDEIDAERGVISEEWRTRRNSSFRMRAKYFPVLFQGSQWGVRDVIGDLEIINNFEPQTIKDFYHDWYRTDLQAVAIIGDFDVAEMEKKVVELLSKIPAVENPKKRPDFTIPEHDDLRFVLATDKEARQSSVNMMILKKKSDTYNLSTIKDNYAYNLYSMMLSARVSEILQKEETACVSANSGIYSDFVRGYGVYVVSATAKQNRETEAFKLIYTEVERVKRHGFLQSELDRAKANYEAYLETVYKSKDKVSNDAYAEKIKNDYLSGKIATSEDFDYQFGNKVLKEITLENMNQLLPEWFTKKNRTVYIQGPTEGVEHTNEEEIVKVISEVESSNIEPYVDSSVGLTLMDAEKLTGGKIVSTEQIEKFEATEWKLSNGAKVIYRHADFDKDDISISAWSKGGTSIYDNTELVSAKNTINFIANYGVADYDITTLRKVMAGKNASINPYINNLEEGFSGSASIKDFETLLQLLYLKFEQPRFDKEAFDVAFAKNKAQIMASIGNPQKDMSDSIRKIIFNYNPRFIIQDENYLEKINFDEINEVYKDRFSDVSDFTFLVVGNMPKEEVQPLIEKYIGALTDKDRKESWIDRKVRGPKGVTEKKLYFPLETPKGTVIVKYANDLEYNAYNRLTLEVIKEVLNFRFMTEIREKEGGTYGVGIYTSNKQYPNNELSLIFQFDSKAEKAEYLKTKCYEVIDGFQKDGATQVELDKIKMNILKNREQSKMHNNYWLGTIKNYYVSGENMDDPNNFENIIENLTIKDISKASQKFFKGADKIDIVVLPLEDNK